MWPAYETIPFAELSGGHDGTYIAIFIAVYYPTQVATTSIAAFNRLLSWQELF